MWPVQTKISYYEVFFYCVLNSGILFREVPLYWDHTVSTPVMGNSAGGNAWMERDGKSLK